MPVISDTIRQLMRPSAADLEPYDPAFTPVEVNLSANENAYELPSSILDELAQAISRASVSRYPLPLASELRAMLADSYNVSSEQVIIGNGGDELIFNLFLAFGGEGHTVVHCPPDFSVYELYAKLAECEVCSVWRDLDSFEIDEDALVSAARTAALTIVASPNNPTGNLVSRSLIERLCNVSPGIVLVDEAYMEFAPAGLSCTDLLATYPNLAVLRTFSKAYALAGARIGYILANPSVISALAAVRQPYSVSVLDQVAASTVFLHREELSATVTQLIANREELMHELMKLSSFGVRVWPSYSNFLLVRVPSAARLRELLRDEHQVLVRDFSSVVGLDDCLRITVGTREENRRLLDGIRMILEHTS